MSNPTIYSFSEAIAQAVGSPTCASKKRLLLGNGFSMACYGEFGYTTLYQEVRSKGLPERVQHIFDKYGETNFESVLRLLDEGAWIAENYGLYEEADESEMKRDYESLKEALTQAITAVHPAHRGMIPNEKYDSAYAFISQFDDIYTVNYDLLLYWCSLHSEPFKFKDLFSKDEDTDGNDCEFMPPNGDPPRILFLHGALHLYSDSGLVRKRVWKDTAIPLVTQIRAALENKQYPLVVAEGDSISKLIQIERSSYLSYCLRKFQGIQGHLFTFGNSLSDQDEHIADVIAKNVDLRHLWIGIRGDFGRESNKRLLELGDRLKDRRRTHMSTLKRLGQKQGDLSVHFFDADSAKVWG